MTEITLQCSLSAARNLISLCGRSFFCPMHHEEASLAQEIHGHIENVCLTGGVIVASLCAGLALTGLIFWWALFASHGAG
jgi:hypothetical protein